MSEGVGERAGQCQGTVQIWKGLKNIQDVIIKLVFFLSVLAVGTINTRRSGGGSQPSSKSIKIEPR